jgi:hypothetical protein
MQEPLLFFSKHDNSLIEILGMLVLRALKVRIRLQSAVAYVTTFDMCMTWTHCRGATHRLIVPFFVFNPLLFIKILLSFFLFACFKLCLSNYSLSVAGIIIFP